MLKSFFLKCQSLSNLNQVFFWFILLSLILVTNRYYELEQIYLYGAIDGKDYFSISQFSPKFSENLSIHKSWRFFFPYLIGLLNKVTGIEILILYQSLIILLIFKIVYLLNILFDSKNLIIKFIFISSIIFAPYFIRLFISLPLLINDLAFILSTIYLVLFLKNKKSHNLIICLIVACFSRQESIFITLTMLICKLIFKKRSQFSNNLFTISLLITLIIFFINYSYSLNSSKISNVDPYSIRIRLALFFLDYSFIDLIIFITYLILPLFLLSIIIIFNYHQIFKNFKLKKLDENFTFLIILILLIISPGVLAGPEISGKNIIRFSTYVSVLVSYSLFLKLNNFKYKISFILIFLFTICIFLQHPRHSISELFHSMILR